MMVPGQEQALEPASSIPLWPVTSILVEPPIDPGEMCQLATVKWLVRQPLRPGHIQGHENVCICNATWPRAARTRVGKCEHGQSA